MVYNAESFVEKKAPSPGSLSQGVVVNVDDGKVKDFVQGDALEKWHDPEQMAINVEFEIVFENEKCVSNEIFSYQNDSDKRVVVSDRSKLGKYKKKYGGLPKVQDKVVVMANQDGYWNMVL